MKVWILVSLLMQSPVPVVEVTDGFKNEGECQSALLTVLNNANSNGTLAYCQQVERG